jgi:hypothetical protein
MRGSIRIVMGLLIVFGAVGGIDTASTFTSLVTLVTISLVGLALMHSGVRASNS